ncbi:alpha/beta fold hydrolase [Streptomyces regalis]|uniref:alpha/beta fold hydrolase n=1 Tax=Streptomyces regalis TaxID=68262 RepID=UPI003CC69D12
MELAHRSRGGGPVLVVIQQLDREGWGPVVDRLSREREVVSVDLPDFGDSPPLPQGTTPTVGAPAEAVTAWLRAAGLGHLPVVGNSLGGAVAIEMAVPTPSAAPRHSPRSACGLDRKLSTRPARFGWRACWRAQSTVVVLTWWRAIQWGARSRSGNLPRGRGPSPYPPPATRCTTWLARRDSRRHGGRSARIG